MYSQCVRRKFLTLKVKATGWKSKRSEDTDLRDKFIDVISDEGLKFHLRQRRMEWPFYDVREIAIKSCDDGGEGIEINSIYRAPQKYREITRSHDINVKTVLAFYAAEEGILHVSAEKALLQGGDGETTKPDSEEPACWRRGTRVSTTTCLW